MGGRPSRTQLAWLEQDLAADHHTCQLAFWHHPRFSSGVKHGSDPRMKAFWVRLQEAGVDIVLNGHEHNYERFDPMLPAGEESPEGIREFVVGTGGIGSSYPFQSSPLPTSKVRLNTLGVLELELRPDGYAWTFAGVDGSIGDEGVGSCH
jgi:alkaline phosphatase